jgi:hypothetical protein
MTAGEFTITPRYQRRAQPPQNGSLAIQWQPRGTPRLTTTSKPTDEQCFHHWVPSRPAPGFDRGKVPIPDSPSRQMKSVETCGNRRRIVSAKARAPSRTWAAYFDVDLALPIFLRTPAEQACPMPPRHNPQCGGVSLVWRHRAPEWRDPALPWCRTPPPPQYRCPPPHPPQKLRASTGCAESSAVLADNRRSNPG